MFQNNVCVKSRLGYIKESYANFCLEIETREAVDGIFVFWLTSTGRWRGARYGITSRINTQGQILLLFASLDNVSPDNIIEAIVWPSRAILPEGNLLFAVRVDVS